MAVEWDNGRGNVYRYGAENAFDLRVVDEARVLRPDEQVKPGVLVTRSRGWRGGDRDGGAGCTGVVFNIDDGGRKVWVRWESYGHSAVLHTQRWLSRGRGATLSTDRSPGSTTSPAAADSL